MTTATASTPILQRVSALPPLPAAVGRLLRLVYAPDVDFREIARTISLDQTLTAQLLRLANSAFYGFPQQIRTVQQAAVILGRHSVRNMALSLAVVRLRHHMLEDGPLRPEDFWRHSMAVACAARLLAQHQQVIEPDEAFVAGLLHDIGKIVLMEYDPATYADLLTIASEGIAPLHVLEKETFDLDHAEVGEALCRHWNIPESLAAVVAAHHGAGSPTDEETLQLVDIVNVADTLAKICSIGHSGNPHVSSTWRGGSSEFARKGSVIRQTLDVLPGEVSENEAMFFARRMRSDKTNREVGRGGVVHVAISPQDDFALVNLALRSRGFDVVAFASDAVTAVVADESLSASDYTRYRHAGVPIQDFSMWRLEQISQDWINLDQLNAWLTRSLAPAIP